MATGVVNEAFQGKGDSSSSSLTPEQQQLANKVQNLAGHTHFGYLILFVLINAFVGLISVGAVNAQALALSRSENRSFLYGYSMALLRLPQLFLCCRWPNGEPVSDLGPAWSPEHRHAQLHLSFRTQTLFP